MGSLHQSQTWAHRTWGLATSNSEQSGSDSTLSISLILTAFSHQNGFSICWKHSIWSHRGPIERHFRRSRLCRLLQVRRVLAFNLGNVMLIIFVLNVLGVGSSMIVKLEGPRDSDSASTRTHPQQRPPCGT